jgi:TonB family protein
VRLGHGTRARLWAIAASVAVHAAVVAAWAALAPHRVPEAPRPAPETVEVRLFAPRAVLAPRAAPVSGERREGREGRAPRRTGPRTGGSRAPRGGAPGPAPVNALAEPRLPRGAGEGPGIPFAGATARSFSRPHDADVAPGAAGVPAEDPDWLRRNQRAIERRIQFTMNTLPYPPDARRRGWRGEVVVAFRLRTNGTVRDVRVARSSGYEALDRCAVEAVVITPRYPRPPVEQVVEVPFAFRLRPG